MNRVLSRVIETFDKATATSTAYRCLPGGSMPTAPPTSPSYWHTDAGTTLQILTRDAQTRESTFAKLDEVGGRIIGANAGNRLL